jgi:hypothetical protein
MKKNSFIVIALFMAMMIFQLVGCLKDYSFEKGIISQGFIIKDALSNNCTATVSGTYNAGKSLGSDNYISANIHISAAGAYTVMTDTINGIWFTAIGQVSATGDFEVKLMGHGTPSQNGIFNYTLTYDSSSCGVLVNVVNATEPEPNNDGYLNAFIDGDSIGFNFITDSLRQNSQGGITTTTLFIEGHTDENDTAMISLVIFTTSSLTAGTYSSSSIINGGVLCTYSNLSDSWTGGGNSNSSSGLVSVTISNITANRATGSFSGTLVSDSGNSPDITITNGAFSVPYQ